MVDNKLYYFLEGLALKTFQLSFKNSQWCKPLPLEFDSENTLLFVYFSPDQKSSSAWQEIKTKFPKAKVMGCSGAGEIKQAEILDREIILTGIHFEKTKIKLASVKDIKGKNSEQVGTELGHLFSKEELKGLYLLSDGLAVNGTALIKGLKNVLGQDLNLSGGLAGDGANFKNTFVLVDGMPTENAATAVGFYGDHINIA
jgi:hypothetical protein